MSRDKQQCAFSEYTSMFYCAKKWQLPEKEKNMTDRCPECGESKYINDNLVGDGFRQCKNCGQDWWVDINYTEKEVKMSKLNELKKIIEQNGDSCDGCDYYYVESKHVLIKLSELQAEYKKELQKKDDEIRILEKKLKFYSCDGVESYQCPDGLEVEKEKSLPEINNESWNFRHKMESEIDTKFFSEALKDLKPISKMDIFIAYPNTHKNDLQKINEIIDQVNTVTEVVKGIAK